ncbi:MULTISPECIES: hypothetical protein [Streptomyces]|uniref:Uncharacterized protein n=1 Tax=Streptomyces heilongjiangensis TaxID=945052 RepID=A0ABW1BFT0_9ACTN|nr:MULTISPECIES: hypothetical protein [Streptomyces]MDC2951831.1 hypothetical protein [Streptomyces heilongjiangensis]
MSSLLRAPRECASWSWELDDYAPPGLESALSVAARMSGVLREHGLLVPGGLEWHWYVYGTGGIGVTTQLALQGPLDDSELPGRLLSTRPAGFPDAQIADLLVSGYGTWIDAAGAERREHRLVELSVSPDPLGLSAEVAVHHDIWGHFDFRGFPHPDIEKHNAPRLAAALQSLDILLGVAAEPGEPTYFGRAEGYGVRTPDIIDGRGPDLTDLL